MQGSSQETVCIQASVVLSWTVSSIYVNFDWMVHRCVRARSYKTCSFNHGMPFKYVTYCSFLTKNTDVPGMIQLFQQTQGYLMSSNPKHVPSCNSEILNGFPCLDLRNTKRIPRVWIRWSKHAGCWETWEKRFSFSKELKRTPSSRNSWYQKDPGPNRVEQSVFTVLKSV